MAGEPEGIPIHQTSLAAHYTDTTMKTIAVVGLVLLVVLTALPLGMAMGSCTNSHVPCGPLGFGTCAAVLFPLILLASGLVARTEASPRTPRLAMLATTPDPPPRH